MIMMRSVIDNNRRLNRKTYCYFAEANQFLTKDCLVELWTAGMREREVYMLYRMNKESNIVIFVLAPTSRSPGFITNHSFQQFSAFIHQFSV